MPRRSPLGTFAVPMSIPRYSCIESALTISPPSCSARSSAKADLPAPVGPTTATTGITARSLRLGGASPPVVGTRAPVFVPARRGLRVDRGEPDRDGPPFADARVRPRRTSHRRALSGGNQAATKYPTPNGASS